MTICSCRNSARGAWDCPVQDIQIPPLKPISEVKTTTSDKTGQKWASAPASVMTGAG